MPAQREAPCSGAAAAQHPAAQLQCKEGVHESYVGRGGQGEVQSATRCLRVVLHEDGGGKRTFSSASLKAAMQMSQRSLPASQRPRHACVEQRLRPIWLKSNLIG